MSLLKISISPLVLLVVCGCSSGNCRQVQEAEKAKNPPVLASKIPEVSGTLDRVKVYKYDGSLQCGMGKAATPEDMQKDLKGIKVYSSENKADGLMHIQQCGTPTGKANVFEIDRKDLSRAKVSGFKEWTFE